MYRLNPEALDQARQIHGFTSDEKLAAELETTGTTVRNWRHGRTSPSIGALMRLYKLTQLPMEDLVIESPEKTAA